MALKKIINDKPKVGDVSQYNFDDGYSTTPVQYDDSTGLPKNNDKFQNKDLFTNCVGDELNEKIIEANLKFQGDPYIRIDNLYISNTGVHGTVKSNHVSGWIFSQEAYGGDPTKDGYSTVRDKMKDEWKFYSSGRGSKGEGEDIGNITNIEGTPIVSNFGINSSQIILGDFDGKTINFNDDGGLDAFKLNNIEDPPPSQTTIFNESQYNPIYIVIYMKGHKKVAWPVNTDERKRRYDIFKISSDDLFERVGNNFIGKVYETNFTGATKSKTGDGGGGATQAAWKVTSLNLSINTSAGVKNTFSNVSNYKEFINQVLPKSKIDENIFNSVQWLSSLNPATQLDNNQIPGASETLERHLDFIPFTSFGFSQNNQLANNYIDLQTYNNDFDLIMKSSTPLNVTFNIDIKGIDGNNFTTSDTFYYYFVIDWNDTEEKFKTIENWLDSKPENVFDYLEKQNQNLYNIYSTRDSNTPNNVYTTPGIKNIKFIMLSVFDGDGTDDSPDFEVGRWKLCTSRIYIDIPPNQYPDFSNVGGSDYTTLPWPFTTPIIGGVSEDSKYKKSIQNTLGGGKIGDFDFIDERFLVNDLENDEMGKNIETMDLEQCRYFNQSYNMNTLLGVNPITQEIPDSYEEDLQPVNYFFNFGYNDPDLIDYYGQEYLISAEYLATLPFPQYREEFDISGEGLVNSYDASEWNRVSTLAFRPDISDLITKLSVGIPPSSDYTYPDYISSWTTTDDIPSAFIPGGASIESFKPYNYINGNESIYWDGETNKFSEETSVGQIFISDNSDLDLKQSCKLELNTGELTGKSILDTSGNSNKGLLIGDYKVKKVKKGQSMRRDSFIKVPKKKSNRNGAL